ncbi:hypothetical protein D3C73_651490 [compost metagenome]
MAGSQHLNRAAICDHQAIKTPRSTENIFHECSIRRAGHAVDFIVGGHNGNCARFNRLLERQQIDFKQLAPAHMHRPGIAAALGAAVAGEMLQRGAYTFLAAQRFPLKPLYRGNGQLADQIGILAKALLRAPPTGIAHDIKHGRIGYRSALAPRLQGHRPAHFPVQVHVP